MKKITFKNLILSLVTLSIVLVSCGKEKEAINTTSDELKSPIGFWTTEDSKLGLIGWKITDKDFKKCTILFNTKMSEEEGSVNISNDTVTYIFKEKTEELTATYNSNDKTLTENQGFKLKYIRADDNKINDFNNKGCHL